MKICILVNDFKAPWAEAGKNNVREISRILGKKHEIFFVGCSDTTENFDFRGSKVYLFKSPLYNTNFVRIFYISGYLNLILGAGKILKHEKPDIILSCFETAGTCFFSYLLKAYAGIPAKLIHMVWTDWHSISSEKPGHWLTENLPHLLLNNKQVSRFGLKFADHIIVTSQYLAGRVSSLGYKNLSFIPGGVNIDTFSPKRLPIQKFKEDIVLGYVGHLTYTKGVSLMLKAVEPVLDRGDVRLVLAVTDGEEADIIRRLNHPRITVYNIVDPARVYNACDLIIVPRRFSYGTASYPNVVLEAMSCATPVLCSDLPGIREIISHRETGFLFQPNNVEALRVSIENLIADKKLLKQTGAKAREKMVQKFQWKDIAPKVEAVIAAM